MYTLMKRFSAIICHEVY